tara:strand:- start:860 stop:1564 length:705 start_codon:yes stop_codon:yes gene_type:complete
MGIINKIFNNRSNNYLNISDINKIEINKKISDIYIIGNGPSLNQISSHQLLNKFTIGTNRSWLWGETDILVWRDNRITEEIDFFQLDKSDSSKWICSQDKSFIKNNLTNYNHVIKNVDFIFKDTWMKNILGVNIKWNGIIFHAIAIAKFISPNAKIHLLGIDLNTNNSNHHFFNTINGFNQGFYNKSWHSNNFNYKSRLDMMYDNFKLLQKNGYSFENYSKKSRLKNLFGYKQL